MVLLLFGCTNNDASHYDMKTDISYQNQNDKTRVVIKGYYDEPDSIRDKKTVIFEGISEGEFVEILVQGEIKDFEYVSLEWDESRNDLVEKETLNRFDKVTNQVIVIKTYMPEGIPSEKVKWKSMNGKTYEYIIREYSLGDENNKEDIFYLE